LEEEDVEGRVSGLALSSSLVKPLVIRSRKAASSISSSARSDTVTVVTESRIGDERYDVDVEADDLLGICSREERGLSSVTVRV